MKFIDLKTKVDQWVNSDNFIKRAYINDDHFEYLVNFLKKFKRLNCNHKSLKFVKGEVISEPFNSFNAEFEQNQNFKIASSRMVNEIEEKWCDIFEWDNP